MSRGQPGGERIGILGGTFDPPHVAHVTAAASVRYQLDLDRVLLVVANEPWQKTDRRPVTPAADRLAMVEAAVDGIDGVEASALEIDRGGASYTADTLVELSRRDPAGSLFLVVGADAAAGLDTWERAAELPGMATLVIVGRPGHPVPETDPSWRTELVEIPRLDISSTELRDWLAVGRPVDGLVPPGVRSVIEGRRIYRGRS